LAGILVENYIGSIVQRSSIYRTAPWGMSDQKDFLNIAFWVLTDKSPPTLLETIHMIETRMGREKTVKWGPRLIDIDIIFYEQQIIKNDHLTIPHPQITNRNFVLTPLMDICPDWQHPELGKTVGDLFNECKDQSAVLEWDNG
jgi:2-amino-4-hydroxy-6-hydroxymethyldihydropteridine diphosphokinase